MKKLCISICTRNRADSLKATIKSILGSEIPKDLNVELLVADNGSRDHTEKVIRSVGHSHLPVRYLYEARTGQCYARNAILQSTDADILLFTDDDVRVPKLWISGMCGPILEDRSDAVTGGVILPDDINGIVSAGPLRAKRSWLACTEGIDPLRPTRMVGANMAFHRRIIDAGIRFDTELGPGALGFGDETMFSWQLVAAGFRLVGALDVAVEHHFDVSRLDPERIRQLARRFGRVDAFFYHHWDHKPLRKAPVWLATTLFRMCRLRRKPSEPSPEELALEERLGFYMEYLRQCLRRPKYASRTRLHSAGRP